MDESSRRKTNMALWLLTHSSEPYTRVHTRVSHYTFPSNCCCPASSRSVVVRCDVELLAGCVQQAPWGKLLNRNRGKQPCYFLIYKEKPERSLPTNLTLFCFGSCAKDSCSAIITDQKTQRFWDSCGWMLDRKWYFHINTACKRNPLSFQIPRPTDGVVQSSLKHPKHWGSAQTNLESPGKSDSFACWCPLEYKHSAERDIPLGLTCHQSHPSSGEFIGCWG